MLNLDDMQLLAEYAARNSEEAFSTLVARYVNLVYSAALRQTGNPHEAQEITQAVFLVLARKAKTLRQGTVLSGWLYHTARLTAANALRGEIRRQNREQQAYMQSTLNQPEPDHWQQVGPLLEQAMSGLSDADRNAIVLRYFENKPLKEVGAALGASDDAAKMRVNRALEKLRKFFVKRGVTLSAAALGAAISAHSVQAAPAGLSTAVIAAACQGSALTASTLTLAKGTLKIMAWTKFHLAVGTAAVAVIALQYVKIENQHQETVALQAQLQRAAQQSEKQLASIKELETRDETMARSLRTVVRESTQSVARKAAAAPAPIDIANSVTLSPKAGGLGSLMENMLKDPDYLKAMTEQQAQMLKTQYAPLVKQLNLTPEQRDAFFAALMDNATNAMSQALVMMSGTNKAGATGVLEDAQKSLQNQMRSLLGDSGFAQFQEYQTTIPDRQLLDSMKTSFADNPLTDDQQQRLLQIMVNERKNSIMPLDPNTGKPVVLEANPAAQMEQTLQTQDQINQRVYQQAANFLSPAQLQSLGTSQTNMLGLVKSMMPMMQKMLGTDDKAGQ